MNISSKYTKLEDKEKSKHVDSDNLLKYIFNQLEKPLLQEVRQLNVHDFSKESLTKSAALKDRLKSGFPISSQRSVSDEELRKDINKLLAQPDRTPAHVSELFAKFDDQPTRCAEILSAGWLYKLETYPHQLQAVFSDKQPNFDNYSQYLTRLDDLVLKSLQLSSVHTTLLSASRGL
jgi:hypothetical protein